MSSNGSPPSSSWPTSSGGPSGSGSPGVLVYVVVLISIAALFSVGALLRFCIRKTPPPGAVQGAAGTGSRAAVPMPLVPEYEGKTVTNPDGSVSLAVDLDHPSEQTAERKLSTQPLEITSMRNLS